MIKKKQIVALFLILDMVLLVACAPKAAPTPVSQAPAPSQTATPSPIKVAPQPAVKATWDVEWEKALAAAKQEGRLSLVFTGAGGTAARVPLAEGFKKAYGIPIESISGPGADIARRVIAERRAGLYNYDVVMGGGTTMVTVLKPTGIFDPLEPALILPEVTDPEQIKKTWWRGKLSWIDQDRTVLFSSVRLNYPIAINTNLVKDGEIKSYRDLLSSKWKEKMTMHDPTVGGTGVSFMMFTNAVLGWDYLVELARTTQPVVMRDQRVQLDWLTHGKVAVVAAPEMSSLLGLMKMGTPVKGLILAEGTWMTAGDSNVALPSKAPHLNAAKVFINWMLSAEGQKVLVVPFGAQSLRLGVSTDHLSPDQLLKEGVKYFEREDEQVVLAVPGMQKKADELLRPLMK